MEKTSKISATIQPEKKELIELLLRKANLKATDVIDNAFTQWIRANLDLLSETDRKKYEKFLVG